MSQQGGISSSGGSGVTRFPITPYTVGPVGEAAYQTVQSALDAANTAGGGLVYVQPGTFTENLTLYNNIVLQGASSSDSIIVGTHTPPTTGSFTFDHLLLQDNNAIVSSAAAGSTTIRIQDCITEVQQGYTLDILNWTGLLYIFNLQTRGLADGGINNTGGSGGIIRSSIIGSGIENDFILSGFFILNDLTVFTTLNLRMGAFITGNHCNFERIVEFTANSIGFFYNCKFTNSAACIDFNSTGELKIASSVLDSSSPVSLSGAGTGIVSLEGVDFVDSSGISTSLTLSSSGTAGGTIALLSGGNRIEIAGGAATDFIGTATLVAGSVTVAHFNITANDRIYVQRQSINGSSTLGSLVYSITPSTNFTIESRQNSSPGNIETNDTSIVVYWIVRQI